MFSEKRIVIKGAGDLATGVAARLWRSGFPVMMTEIEQPLTVRRSVSLSDAVYEGEVTVEDMTARRAEGRTAVLKALDDGVIPVIVDPKAEIVKEIKVFALIDAIEEAGESDKIFKLDEISKFSAGPGSSVYGYLTVNLTNVQQFGMSSNQAIFQVKQEKPAKSKIKTHYNWRSYLTDQHRIKTILLKQGNYYLKFNNKVRKAFMVKDNNQRIDVVLN